VTRTATTGLEALIAALRAHGGTLAETLLADPPAADGPPGPPQLAATGPRAAGREAEYELLLEMILEGSLLHYGAPRVLRDEDRDLSLLLGDQLYALGLSRLAGLGDLEAVAELADLISLVAAAYAAEHPALAAAVWRAGAAAIGWGASSEHEAAKALARRGDPQALRAFETVATSVVT
jgi:hypothetical protein